MKNTVNPWRFRGGCVFLSSRATSGKVNHSGKSFPLASRSRSSVPEMLSDALALGDFVRRHVAVLVLEVDHHLERHHGDAELFLVLLQELLGVVRTVKRRAARIAPRAGVVAADDQVRAAVVLTDDRVPHRLRAVHPSASPAEAATGERCCSGSSTRSLG